MKIPDCTYQVGQLYGIHPETPMIQGLCHLINVVEVLRDLWVLDDPKYQTLDQARRHFIDMLPKEFQPKEPPHEQSTD